MLCLRREKETPSGWAKSPLKLSLFPALEDIPKLNLHWKNTPPLTLMEQDVLNFQPIKQVQGNQKERDSGVFGITAMWSQKFHEPLALILTNL